MQRSPSIKDLILRILHDTSQLEMTGPSDAQVGQEVEYLLWLNNLGQSSATNILVNYTLPASGMAFVQSSQKTAQQDQNLLWYVDALNGGEMRENRVRLRCELAGEWVTQAEVSSNEGVQVRQQVTTRVSASTLTLQARMRPETVALDQNVELVMTLNNAGTERATGVVLAVKLPSALTLVSAGARGQVAPDGLITWDVQALNPGAREQILLRAKVIAAGNHIVRASVTTAEDISLTTEAIVSTAMR